MSKGDDLLEIDENFGLDKIKGIENKFDYFMRENDLLYEDKIKFNINYNLLNNYYTIKILPAKDGFDSQEYFGANFEEGIGREKLRRFIKENNVVFSY